MLSDFIKISDFAKLCNVTRQTVYRYVKELEANKENLEQYIIMLDDTKHLTLQGQKYILDKLNITKDELEKNYKKIEKKKEATSKDNKTNIDGYTQQHINMLEDSLKRTTELVKTLEGQLDTLNSQLNVKDIQIAEKDKQINSLTNILNSNTKALEDIVKTNREGQYLEYLDKAPIKEDAPQQEETDTQKKESFFSRLFKNFR